MKRTIVAILAAGGLCAAAANADTFLFESFLSGLNEVPPNASPGTGYVLYEFDDVTNMLSILNGDYMDLMGVATAAHVHVGVAGMNGGVTIPLVVSGGNSGTVSGGGALDPDLVDDLFGEGLYTNVHSDLFPGGEIRDQLRLVPAPASAALLGLGGLAVTRRRR